MRKRNNKIQNTKYKILSSLIALAVTGTVMVGANTAYAACGEDGCTICANATLKEGGSIGIGDTDADFNSIQLGWDLTTRDTGIAVGIATQATGECSIAMGSGNVNGSNGAFATGKYAVAIGSIKTTASAENSVALGRGADASEANSVALGANSRANVANVVSVGYGSNNAGYTQYRHIINVDSLTAEQIEQDDYANYAVNVTKLNNALANVSGGSGGVTSAVTAVTFDDATGQLSVAKTEIKDGATTDTTSTVDLSGFYASNQSVNDIVGLTDTATTVNDAYKAANNSTGTNYLGSANTLVEADVALDSAIKANADAIANVKNDVTALDGRVDTLETTVGTLEGTVAGLQQATAAQNEKITALETDVDTLKTDVDDLQAADETLQNNIDTLGNTVTEQGDRIGTLETNVSTLETTVNNITSISTDVIGAGDADTLTNTYQETTHLKEATTLVEADVALDKAIQNNTTAIETNKANIEANSQAITANSNAIAGLNRSITRLDGRLDKVGAGAAALAALHPLDYDPEDKLSFSAGVGNYGGETAGAVGAFYRPNEDVMFSIGGTAGNGENMVNLGVSFAIGKGSSGIAKMSKAELVQEVTAVKEENKELKAENREIRHELNKLKELVLKLAEEK